MHEAKLSAIMPFKSAINPKPFLVNHESSTINHELFLVNHEPSAINHELFLVNHEPSAINYELFLVNHACNVLISIWLHLTLFRALIVLIIPSITVDYVITY